MAPKSVSRCLLAAGLVAVASAQCPNEVAAYNPNIRTLSQNNTFFIVPVPNAAAQTAVDANYGKTLTGASNVQLLPVPSSDTSLFPSGFPADHHPVLVTAGVGDDIRMGPLQIQSALLQSLIIVPYVRRFDSQPGTVLAAQVEGYLAGMGNNALAGLVPNTVSTLIEGLPDRLGFFSPDSAAYQLNDGGVYSNKVAWNVLPNPISGPGINFEAVDMQYVSTKKLTKTTAKLFKAVSNQPQILTGLVGNLAGNLCQRNQVYFNNATSTIYPRAGNVTFGPGADGTLPQLTGALQKASPDGSGVYSFLEGISACAQLVDFNPENCDTASKNVDPTAL